ncbi:MAG: 50S ribosomal protein L1 [Deltaproteobacteria bacterium]|nr:50S ribosomal protein L1 [Deltaproteobacteria bacterium]
MSRITKRAKENNKTVEQSFKYALPEAVEKVKKCANAKFDESVDVAMNLGVDPRKADQMIRGSVELPHGTGKKLRVVVIAKGEKISEASEAGADHVGGQELVDKIQEGWLDFDRLVATPDMMGAVGKVGKILGPRGLMPNPKVGTVTFDVGKVVTSIKKGLVEFRVDKAGILHVPVGRASFEAGKLQENVTTLLDTVRKLRPASAKGTYIRSMTLSSTMGPGVQLDTAALLS